ncbi:MAG: hypothetical protein QM808_18190 [Steroidobacteraceae bacterium]
MDSHTSLLPWLMLGLCAANSIAVADAQTRVVSANQSWSGRKLNAVLDELRSAGLPLLYSSQIVSDELVIDTDPAATLQLDRLRLALKTFNLELQALPMGQGYTIIRNNAANAVEPAEKATPNTSAAALEEVVVFASRYNLTRDESSNANVQLPHASLEKTAGIEQDVLRSVQYLPGAAGNSLSTLTHVRGGYEDENLVRFDGVELYKPVHLKDFQGLFGLLDPDWVQTLNFYSGAYPVQFGNHNAAVIDLAPRNTAETHYTIGASMLYSRLHSTGSYANEAGHWLVGYRTSNVSQVIKHTENSIGEPEFEDFVVRHSYHLADGELRMGALRLNDDLDLETNSGEQRARAHDHDSYLWLGWQQDASEALHYDVQLAQTQLTNRRNAQMSHTNIAAGSLNDERNARLFTLDSNLSLQTSAHLQWLWGVHINHSRANYKYSSEATYLAPLSSTFAKSALQRYYTHEFSNTDYASYLNLTQQWGAWRAETGLRYDVFPYLNHGRQLSPRINLQYAVNDTRSIHVSAGNYVQAQALHMLDSSAATPRFNPPERMRQYILGWTQALTPDLQLRVEAYRKRGSRLAPRNENLLSIITLASELEIDRNVIQATHSRAQGLEVSLTAPAKDSFGWWLNYSWSRVQDQIAGVYVRRSWDQPHALTAGLNWSSNRWLLSGSSTLHSGWAYTPLQLNANSTSATLGQRNSQRFNDFASLELRAQYSMPVRAAQLQLFLELRNALDRDNICCRDITINTDNTVSGIAVENQTGLSLVPIAGVNLKF